MLGDAGKPGGVQERLASMNLDLQLSQKEASNEKLGEFVCLCANALGIRMDRIGDKMLTGDTARLEVPVPAYRWTSARSGLKAWLFNVELGLHMDEVTSDTQVRMEWIFFVPSNFLKRFVHGLADSDGTVRTYVVEVASMPNAEFITRALAKLGLRSARTIIENGRPMRSSVHHLEAAGLPIFNEYAEGYRFQALMRLVRSFHSRKWC